MHIYIHDDLCRLLFLQADRKTKKYFRLIEDASLQYKYNTPDYLSERKFAVFLKPQVRLLLAKATAIQMSVGSVNLVMLLLTIVYHHNHAQHAPLLSASFHNYIRPTHVNWYVGCTFRQSTN